MFVDLGFLRVLLNFCALKGEIETWSSRGSRVTAGSIALRISFYL